MGTADRPTDRDLIDELLAHPGRFNFFQVVRLLERIAGGVPVGYDGPFRKEMLRFRAADSLAFPIGEVDEITRLEPDKDLWGGTATRYLVTSNFIGLYGPSSPLPAFYTERIIKEGDLGDLHDRERLRDFLDIYHHRIYSLFYRALFKYRYHLQFRSGGADVFSQYMLCLIGRGTRGIPENRPISAVTMIRYSGLLTQQPKSAEGLQGLLADFFSKIPIAIKQCVGRWLRVEDQNRIGQAFSRLGEDCVVGSRMYDCSGKFRVSIGPVDLAIFSEFLPRKPRMIELIELVHLYLLDELEFDVEIWIRKEEVPSIQLGKVTDSPLLGLNSWTHGEQTMDRSVIFRAA